MQLIHAVLLGIAQGLTEFLPVSSSAHLIILRDVLGWRLLDDPHWNMIFDVSAHAGTFVALIVYFRADIRRLVAAFIASFRVGIGGDPERRLAWIIAVATVPAALAGVLVERPIETILRQAPSLVAAFLLIFGLILWHAERRGGKTKSLGDTGWLDGMLIGCAQALALAPGVSRSGITMTIGLARGMTREAAARFSFLLSIPIIAGAALYGLKDVLGGMQSLPQGSLATFGAGFASAALSGYFCVRFFLKYLRRHAFGPFVIYRVAMGVFLLVWFAVR